MLTKAGRPRARAAAPGGPAPAPRPRHDAGADAAKAGPTKGPGRKPKQAASTKAAPSTQDGAAGPQGQAPGQPEAEAGSGLTGGEALAAAAVPQAGTAADSNPVQPARDPVSDAARSVPEAEASVPAAPAAHWDRATDRVQFDWPTIGRVAAQDGPNQAMAKLLVAARAEGAQSRWPF